MPLARGRSFGQLRRLLAGSDAVVSLGAASGWWALAGPPPMASAGPLWDIVVAGDCRAMASADRNCSTPRRWWVERVYLMTTKSAGFYRQLGSRMQIPNS